MGLKEGEEGGRGRRDHESERGRREGRRERGGMVKTREGWRKGGKEGRGEKGREKKLYRISLGEVGTRISCPLCCVAGQMLLTANEWLEGFCDRLAFANRGIREVQ